MIHDIKVMYQITRTYTRKQADTGPFKTRIAVLVRQSFKTKILHGRSTKKPVQLNCRPGWPNTTICHIRVKMSFNKPDKVENISRDVAHTAMVWFLL
ncbi:MAG: hypothetical protein D6677_00510 [Calditrichaeota bacterium]|nr:MAG: hypothetical protein D6677_00510 [Calditrichota bacterium]